MKKSLIAFAVLAAGCIGVASAAPSSSDGFGKLYPSAGVEKVKNGTMPLQFHPESGMQKTKYRCGDPCVASDKLLQATAVGKAVTNPTNYAGAQQNGQQFGSQYIIGAINPPNWIAWQVH